MYKHIFLVIVMIGSVLLWGQRPANHGPGILAPEEPLLRRTEFKEDIRFQNFTLIPRWEIRGTSRIVSKKSYWFDEKKHLSPYDMVLGWDAMSDEQNLSHVQVPISNRQYDIEIIRSHLTAGQMREQLLYAHVIPSDEEVSKMLKEVKEGDIITYKGFIVDVEDQSNWRWTSSIDSKKTQLDHSQILWLQNLSSQ